MKVSLFDYTGNETANPADYAATRLIFTKSTRLNMSPGLLDEIKAWPYEKKMDELTYMANTVPSSWEFCDYSFIIEGVTRAFTHQLVRTRTASYAQQAMRVLDMGSGPGWSYATGPTIDNTPCVDYDVGMPDSSKVEVYRSAMEDIDHAYKRLIASGVAVQDARGLLPTNILTNICMKLNMRNFIDLAKKRSSSRVQDEYRSVIEEMKARVLEVHPWTAVFMNRTADVAARELQDAIDGLGNPGKGVISEDQRIMMIKLLDQIRKEL